MPLKVLRLIAITFVTLMVLVIGAQAQQSDDPFAPPTRAWQQGAIYQNTIPRDFETHIIANNDADRARAQRIIDLYRLLEANPTNETLSEFISDRYIQHSIFLPNGRAPLAELFGGSVEEYPVALDVHKVIVVGDWAMAHVNFRNLDTDSPKDKGMAAVDMYLFDADGKITEHWDSLQVVPSHSPNPNGMFVTLFEGE
ncbi:MAG: nuclear transport factor 2 family protein [Cyanobacteria bacterium J06648_16]